MMPVVSSKSAKVGSSLAEVPAQAISISIKQILKSRNILCIVPDQRKAEAVRATVGLACVPPQSSNNMNASRCTSMATRHHSSSGPGIAQSHQLGPHREQSVQTHTAPQTSVPSHARAQQVKPDASTRSAGRLLLAFSTCTPNAFSNFISLPPTCRVVTASVVAICNSTLPSRIYGVSVSFFPSRSIVNAVPTTCVTLAQ